MVKRHISPTGRHYVFDTVWMRNYWIKFIEWKFWRWKKTFLRWLWLGLRREFKFAHGSAKIYSLGPIGVAFLILLNAVKILFNIFPSMIFMMHTNEQYCLLSSQNLLWKCIYKSCCLSIYIFQILLSNLWYVWCISMLWNHNILCNTEHHIGMSFSVS